MSDENQEEQQKQKELPLSEMNQDPYSYADKLKTGRWSLRLSHKQYGELLIRLTYDNLSRKQITQGIYDLYMNSDSDFLKCLDKIKDRFQKKHHPRTKKTRKMIERAAVADNLLAEQMGLREKDIDDLYTFLEKDLPVSLTDESKKEEKTK